MPAPLTDLRGIHDVHCRLRLRSHPGRAAADLRSSKQQGQPPNSYRRAIVAPSADNFIMKA